MLDRRHSPRVLGSDEDGGGGHMVIVARPALMDRIRNAVRRRLPIGCLQEFPPEVYKVSE
jgi:hypothetical protein